MKLLICSDSHGRLSRFAEILDAHATTADALLFLGDGARDLSQMQEIYPRLPVFAVRGNNDLFAGDLPTESTLSFFGRRFLLLHGHNQGAKQGEGGLISAGLASDADIVLFGHTHRHAVLTVSPESLPPPRSRPLFLWNPGAVADGFFALLESDRRGNLLFSPTRLER